MKIGKARKRALVEALNARSIPYERMEGEAAFYGPKIDIKVEDAIGRFWQLTTVQFDFNLPERFQLEYIGEDNKPHQPVMVHRALFGSMERFFGVLIEHYAGAFPLWLAPVQVAVLPITDRINEYAEKVARELRAAGLRVEVESAQRKDRREDSRRADAKGSVHAGARRPRDGARTGGGSRASERRHRRDVAG